MPDPTPFNSGYLQVSDLHKLYFHEYGNPDGFPVLAPHGGPGSNSKPKYASLYDLNKFRIILFDQRGCGKSTPYGELKENTTQELVKDMEKLREQLKVEKWHLHGPSWGSTLALLYAQKYPARVEKIVLRGVFLGSKAEDNWIHEFGANQVFPDFFDKFLNSLPEDKRDNYVDYLYAVATGDDPKLKAKLLPAFNAWEGSILTLEPQPEEEVDIEREIASGKIMLHYMINNFFLEQEEILFAENIEKIKEIPTVIINGRYDMVTPMISAWRLHKALPKSKLEIVTLAGHHGSDLALEKVIKEYLKFDW